MLKLCLICTGFTINKDGKIQILQSKHSNLKLRHLMNDFVTLVRFSYKIVEALVGN